MWFRFVFIGLCYLAAVSRSASDQTENLDHTSSILGKSLNDQLRSSETNSFDRITETLQNQKELIQNSTESNPNEKESSKHGENQKPGQPSLLSTTNLKESSKVTENNDNSEKKEKDVCFPQLGCFKMGKPWKSALRPIGTPNSPEEIQTAVHFYNRQNSQEPIYISLYPEINMGRARFDSNKKSVIIIHGFGSTGNATWVKDLKSVYLKEVDANILIVDWGAGAEHTNYIQVVSNTRVVGRQLALFVHYLIENFRADPRKFHLIGHSLGAQISSYLGKDVPGIGRLTALDPAQPGFEGFEKEVRLDKTDAEFVDVIHTSARPLIPTLGFGMIGPQGHVDFYMNGGYNQPGCIYPDLKNTSLITGIADLAKITVEALLDLVSCSHGRAYEYFIESLNKTNKCTFWGHKADSGNIFKSVTNALSQGLLKEITALSSTCSKDDCIPLGFNTEKSPLRGIFVVTTNQHEPYCISEVQQTSKTVKAFNTVKEKVQTIGNLFGK